MRVINKTVVVALMSVLTVVGLCGCNRGSDTPGEKLDRALDKTGDAIKDAGEAIKPK